MFFVQLTPTRDSTSELLDALRQREVAVFGPSTPGQTRTPNEENGTPKRDFFSGLAAYYALRISIADRALRCIADRGTAEAAAQQQQHSSSSTAAVVAATSRLRTKRTSVDTPVSLLFSFLRFRAI